MIIGCREFKIDRIIGRKRVFDQRTGKSCEVFTCRMEGTSVRIVIEDSGDFEIDYL